MPAAGSWIEPLLRPGNQRVREGLRGLRPTTCSRMAARPTRRAPRGRRLHGRRAFS